MLTNCLETQNVSNLHYYDNWRRTSHVYNFSPRLQCPRTLKFGFLLQKLGSGKLYPRWLCCSILIKIHWISDLVSKVTQLSQLPCITAGSTEYNSDVVVLLLTISSGNCPNTAGPTNYCSKKADCCLMWTMSQFISERVHKLSGWFHAQSHLIMLKCDTCLGSVHWTSILCLDC